MKIAPNDVFLKALLSGQREWIIAELYTFTSVSGQVDRFTTLDWDVTVEGNTYKSNGLRIEGLRMKIGVGVSVDEQDVTIWAAPTDTLFGAVFLPGMANGIMDGGTIARDRVVWNPTTGNTFIDIQATPAALWRMFLGYMSSIDRLGRASVEFKVKSPLVKLNIDMPRNFYQPGCLWSLFDTGCTLDRNDFKIEGEVLAANQTGITVVGGVSPVLGGDSLPYFQSGRLLFTSGVNDGLTVTLDTNDSAALYYAYPIEEFPSPGDTFTAYAGCSKAHSTCQFKFNNTQNFRGFDLVPAVQVAV